MITLSSAESSQASILIFVKSIDNSSKDLATQLTQLYGKTVNARVNLTGSDKFEIVLNWGASHIKDVFDMALVTRMFSAIFSKQFSKITQEVLDNAVKGRTRGMLL
jgi:hypothetical protein